MSGRTRSAKFTVSEWNASTTTRNGILYSPDASFARSMSCTDPVFMVEFQAMLAMKRTSVSIGYGSAFAAFAMTMCIAPCAAIGEDHEYA